MTAVPITVAPSYSETVDPSSADPASVGVVSFVIASVEEDPVSLAAVRAGVDGAAGAAVSMRTRTVPVSLWFPRVSRAEKLMLWRPSPATEMAAVLDVMVTAAAESTEYVIEAMPEPAEAVRLTTTGPVLL